MPRGQLLSTDRVSRPNRRRPRWHGLLVPRGQLLSTDRVSRPNRRRPRWRGLLRHVYTSDFGQFVGRQLDCYQLQTQINDVFAQPTLSDRATSSDLDIRWRELTRRRCDHKPGERSERVHLLGADWLPRKQRCHFLANIGPGSTSADSLYDVQAAKCKWRALRHTCLLLWFILGGMPASHQGMQARLFVVDIYIKLH